MSEPVFYAFDSREALADTLANEVSERLLEAVQDHGAATLVVSGGSTPVAFFEALRLRDVPWKDVTVTVADERWVEATHDDSNEKLVRELLVPERVQYLSLAPLSEEESIEEGASRIQAKLQTIGRVDVVILGMGEDGHTASLFPQHTALKDGLDLAADALCLAIKDSPKLPSQRITLTGRILCNARHLMLHITGNKKKEVLDAAMTSGDGYVWPIASILRQCNTTPEIYWAG